MKKIIISMAAASLVATSAMAADKGIDFTTTGQAVVFYQTADTAGDDLFDQSKASANIGIQLNNVADLKNGFTLGTQLTYLGTAGLEKNLVSGTMQNVGGVVSMNDSTDEVALTKIYLAKKVANTTVKIGRQELPKALSPLAFSEGWNVFKNTYEAALLVNTDLPNTTIVGAYVGQSNKHSDLGSFTDLTVSSTAGALAVTKEAYMLTVLNTSLPMTTLTGSYYALKGITAADSADAVWLDAKVAGKSLPMGLKAGLQVGSIMPEASITSDTNVVGLKAGVSPMESLTVCGAFTYVSGEKDSAKHIAAVKNTGTGVKTPLYTQIVGNQNAIALDAKTVMLKGAYSLNKDSKIIAQGSYTQAGSRNLNGNGNDNTDLELLYTTKVSGMNLLAGYLNVKNDNDDVANHIVRVVARYNF